MPDFLVLFLLPQIFKNVHIKYATSTKFEITECMSATVNIFEQKPMRLLLNPLRLVFFCRHLKSLHG